MLSNPLLYARTFNALSDLWLIRAIIFYIALVIHVLSSHINMICHACGDSVSFQEIVSDLHCDLLLTMPHLPLTSGFECLPERPRLAHNKESDSCVPSMTSALLKGDLTEAGVTSGGINSQESKKRNTAHTPFCIAGKSIRRRVRELKTTLAVISPGSPRSARVF